MHEILVIGLVGHFEKYDFKVFLRSLRTQIGPVNGNRREIKGQGRGVCRKVLHKFFIEYPNTHHS